MMFFEFFYIFNIFKKLGYQYFWFIRKILEICINNKLTNTHKYNIFFLSLIDIYLINYHIKLYYVFRKL